MDILEEIYQQSNGSETGFLHKNVLFIGSESYDAPTITIIQGLDDLGFEVYTIKKPNINSWFCNKVVDSTDGLKFDFVLSNLSWGTKWSYYEKYNLKPYLKVLIDGDDNQFYCKSWRKKYSYYEKSFVFNPPEDVKNLNIMPYRWVESLGSYEPDIVFVSQKSFDDKESLYLPFGIHKQYYDFFINKSTAERSTDFLHVPGPALYKDRMNLLLRICRKFKIIPGNIKISEDRSREVVAEKIRENFLKDDNVHSYHRWAMSVPYFDDLNNAKVLIYPGIDPYPFWDSKRQWEAYASGCLVMMSKPNIDVSEYPITEICNYAVYGSYLEFIQKCRYLYNHQDFLDKLRRDSFERSKKYFTPKPIANYFLKLIKENIKIN